MHLVQDYLHNEFGSLFALYINEVEKIFISELIAIFTPDSVLVGCPQASLSKKHKSWDSIHTYGLTKWTLANMHFAIPSETSKQRLACAIFLVDISRLSKIKPARRLRF